MSSRFKWSLFLLAGVAVLVWWVWTYKPEWTRRFATTTGNDGLVGARNPTM